MKKLRLIIPVLCLALYANAGVTTYTFTSVQWASKTGSDVCDGVSDGWVCNKAASDYSVGRTDAQGRLYSQGVSVKTGTSGAGATSVRAFTNVRKLTLNFCQNSSKGRGVFYYQIGDNPADSLVIYKPSQSGAGVYNRDSVMTLPSPQSGNIRFWVRCTENAININSLTIRAEEGGTTPFTTASYRLVTDVNQLQDSDQIIIGVHNASVPYIMGYYDEQVSVNNIHAIRGSYSTDRMTVAADDNAIYTLRKAVLPGGTECFVIQDELRYEEAYLVASGGKTKNRLALWTSVYDKDTYGYYGCWDISIDPSGEAVIMSLGNSVGKYLQYNASNSPTLFGCYAAQGSQTPVCIYRRTEALGDTTAIVAPLINFGTKVLKDTSLTGSKTITVNANRLTEDITVSFRHGTVFSASVSTIDRDGDELTVQYSVTAEGHYADTLVLTSGTTETAVPVLLTVVRPLTVAEAVQQPEYALTYLNDVVVTKKFDMYVFVRDTTGSLLIFDGGNGATGKRYAADHKNGDILSGVCGRFRNYYGVPEIAPVQEWSTTHGAEAEAEADVLPLDSADVCRLVRLENVTVSGSELHDAEGHTVAVKDAFNLHGFIEDVPTNTTAVVMLSWNELQLWIVSQDVVSAFEDTENAAYEPQRYTILGQPADGRRGIITVGRSGKRMVVR